MGLESLTNWNTGEIVAATATGGIIIGYALGRFHALLNGKDYSERVPPLPSETVKDDDEYPTRSLEDALRYDSSHIKGTVRESVVTQNGFTGIISDGKKDVPFFINNSDIYIEEEALVPLLLGHSLRNQTQISLDITRHEETNVFNVDKLYAQLNGNGYEIQVR